MKKLLFLLFITSSVFGQTKISDMTAAADLSGTVFVPIIQGGLNKKASGDLFGPARVLPEVGTIISENWPDLTKWTKVGTQTFTVSSNTLSVVGGSPGAITLSN